MVHDRAADHSAKYSLVVFAAGKPAIFQGAVMGVSYSFCSFLFKKFLHRLRLIINDLRV